MRRFRLITINTIFLLVFTHLPLLGQSIYFNDFENYSDPLTEWSLHGSVPSDWTLNEPILSPTPGTEQHPSDRFLGQFSGNDSTSLTLNNLPPHSTITISFDLYIIRSWDGSTPQTYGIDVWDMNVAGGPTLLHTSFSNWFGDFAPQAYPDTYPDGNNPGFTGAAEIDTLGFFCSYKEVNGVQDSVYRFYGEQAFTFSHSAESLVINFSGDGLQSHRVHPSNPENVWDESWGLDNVLVTPEPATLFLLGLGSLALLRKRRA